MSDSKNTLLAAGQKNHQDMTYSTDKEVDQVFVSEMIRRAKPLIEEDRHQEAERFLRQALERMPDNKECQSYIAVCLAGKRKFVSAEKLAKNVIRNNPFDAIAYYALGRVNLLGSRRGSAFHNLAKARTLASGDNDLEHEVERLDPRRKPVLGFLSRNHFLNRMLGRLRAKMSPDITD